MCVYVVSAAAARPSYNNISLTHSLLSSFVDIFVSFLANYADMTVPLSYSSRSTSVLVLEQLAQK